MAQVLARASWGARAPVPHRRFVASAMQGVAVHYNGGPVPSSALTGNPEGYLRITQNFHMQGRGWSDVAYNLAVDQQGRIWTLRGLLTESGANGDNERNRHWVAVLAILGGDQQPSAEMLAGIRDAVRLVQAKYPNARKIVGHRDIRQTDCPGDHLYRHIQAGTFNPARTPFVPAVPEEDDVSAGDVWKAKFREYYDQNGNRKRDPRTTADILFSTHSSVGALLRGQAATNAAVAALASLVGSNASPDEVRTVVAEEIDRALGDLPDLSEPAPLEPTQ